MQTPCPHSLQSQTSLVEQISSPQELTGTGVHEGANGRPGVTDRHYAMADQAITQARQHLVQMLASPRPHLENFTLECQHSSGGVVLLRVQYREVPW